MSRRRFVGWRLDRAERRTLLAHFPPHYREAVADHVTYSKPPGHPGRPTATAGEIVGATDDGRGVQALVVRIDGTTDRPDGSTYHITWSLGPGREARESNDVLRTQGWRPLERPVPLRLGPKA